MSCPAFVCLSVRLSVYLPVGAATQPVMLATDNVGTPDTRQCLPTMTARVSRALATSRTLLHWSKLREKNSPIFEGFFNIANLRLQFSAAIWRISLKNRQDLHKTTCIYHRCILRQKVFIKFWWSSESGPQIQNRLTRTEVCALRLLLFKLISQSLYRVIR